MLDRDASATVGSSARAVVVGAGFTGLCAALELAQRGIAVTVLESDDRVGGLAGSFDTNGASLEKFYHHWFTNDTAVSALVDELGLRDRLSTHPTATGMYVRKSMLSLSTPLDVLRFSPLPFADRLRLGWLMVRARAVRDWRELDHLSAREWLIACCGRRVYEVVWEPLLVGKFGRYAEDVSAAWLWCKLRLRGGSRDRAGREMLSYFRGGFAALADAIAARIVASGGDIHLNCVVSAISSDAAGVHVQTSGGEILCDAAVVTTALPIAAELLERAAPPAYVERLRSIEYLANRCLVLRLDRPLSDLYWINVNDPSFPFVGVIEHTNFQDAGTYGGDRIVYLSRYLPVDDPAYTLSDDAYYHDALLHLSRMFADFSPAFVRGYDLWSARYAQPVVVRDYGRRIPPEETPLANVRLCSMAQIYPQDRGTNYAIERGRAIGRRIAGELAPK